MPTNIVGPTAEYRNRTSRYNSVQAYQVYREMAIESTWFDKRRMIRALPGDFVVIFPDSGDQLVFPAEQFIKIYEPKESLNNE